MLTRSIVLALLFVLSGCASRIPFTHELRAQHDLGPHDIEQLQFYLSHTVTMRREVESGSRHIDGGRLEVRAGKTIEEVVIAYDTPGVAVGVNDSALTVSFEEGSALEFSLRTGRPIALDGVLVQDRFAEPPRAFPRDHHEPASADLLGSYFLTFDEAQAVLFAGRRFEAIDESFRAHLLIDSESLEEIVESRVILGGRRL